MDNNYTDITVVLDRSGSMASMKADVIGGYNTFIEEQKRGPGRCVVSLYQFDDEYEKVYAGIPITEVVPRTMENFIPRGSTALLDALGKTIKKTGKRLSALPEDKRPGLVIFVVITDGEENASKKYTRDEVFKMISHQKDAYKWQFVFLASNQDAISVGRSYGFNAGTSMTYQGGVGSGASIRSLSSNTYQARASLSAGQDLVYAASQLDFTDEDRKKAMEAALATNSVDKLPETS